MATQADVRDTAALKAALDDGVAQLGHVDIVLANAGIAPMALRHECPTRVAATSLDVNLTGVWNTIKAGRRT